MKGRILPENAVTIPDHAECVFRGKIFEVFQWQQEMFDGSFETFEMLRRPDSVIILAFDENAQVFVIDEKQPGGISRTDALPSGRVDETDASLLAAAKREMLEETGWAFENWRHLSTVQPESKIEWFVHLFLATRPLERVAAKLDAGEITEVKKLPFNKCQDSKFARYFSSFFDEATINESLKGVNDS